MDWLLHNPLTNLNGPQFLAVYALVIVVALLWFYSKIRNVSAGDAPPPKVPEQPDPYEIAYLRGGAAELLRMVILSLLQRRYLERQIRQGSWFRSGEELLAQSPGAPDERHLNEIEEPVYQHFRPPTSLLTIFRTNGLVWGVDTTAKRYRTKLTEEGMLLTGQIREAGLKYLWPAIAVIAGLGGYRFVTSMIKGKHNLFFLFLEMAIGLGILAVLYGGGRLSSRGKAHLEALKTAFNSYRTSGQAPLGYSDELLLLLASVYGMHVLGNTGYAYYLKMIQQAQPSQSGTGGSGGSSCGSSCSSGSSCGSSCGGGGCGGCGGGD